MFIKVFDNLETNKICKIEEEQIFTIIVSVYKGREFIVCFGNNGITYINNWTKRKELCPDYYYHISNKKNITEWLSRSTPYQEYDNMIYYKRRI